MIKIEMVTVLISVAANWNVMTPQGTEQQPRTLLPHFVISHLH